MLLASVATVVYMPLAVPVLVDGFSAGAWTIAKPLLFFLLVPLAIGMAIQARSASLASRLQPMVKRVTGLDTLLMLGLCVVIYGKAFLGLIGSYAIVMVSFGVLMQAAFSFAAASYFGRRVVVERSAARC